MVKGQSWQKKISVGTTVHLIPRSVDFLPGGLGQQHALRRYDNTVAKDRRTQVFKFLHYSIRQWVEGLKAHLMIIVPDRSLFDNISTDPNNGGPWIMWSNTPYAHIMVPVDSYPNRCSMDCWMNC